MRAFELIVESTKVQGNKISTWKKMLISHYVDFMFAKLNVSFPLIVKLKKMPKGINGSMELKLMETGDNVITLSADLGIPVLLIYIAHEAIHIKQVNDGALGINADGILWNGEPYISANDYSNLSSVDYAEYVKLPWESEAITASKSIAKEYISNNVYEELAGQDAMLDAVIDIGF